MIASNGQSGFAKAGKTEFQSAETESIAPNSIAAGTARARPIMLLIVCGIALIAAIAIGTAITIFNLRERELADSKRELSNTALLLSKHLDSEIQELELVQNGIFERMQSLGIVSSEEFERKMSGEDVHWRLKDRISGLSHVDAVTLINADGKLINFSRYWPIPAVNVADRDYFKALKSDPSLTSFISEPVRNRGSGTWTIYLARKFTAPNGEFLGLVLGAMELQYFERFFEAIILGESSSIALFRRDGVLLARYPRVDTLIGRSFGANALFIKLVEHFNHGAGRQTGVVDGEDRLIAAHRIAHYPVVVVVTTTVAAALANWRGEAILLIGAGGLAAFMIAVVVFVIARQLLQGKKRFRQELAEQKLQLDIAVNNMSQGLLLFDSSKRVVLCNRQYIEMHGLSPDVVKPGCTIHELVRHRKETGGFVGDVEQYCAELDAAIAQGTTTSRIVETTDGRSIQIVNQPMAGGGWVATHEDITERRRAEQERDRNREFLNQIIENVPAMIIAKEAASRRIVLANRAAEAIWRIPRTEALGKTAHELFPRAQADLIDKSDDEAMRSYRPLFFDAHPNMARSGDLRILTSKKLAIRDNDGKPTFVVSVVEDVTERKLVEQERDRDREFLNRIINNVPTTIIVKDASNRRYVLINQAGEQYFGVSRDQIIGKTAQEVWPKAIADMIAVHDEQVLQSDGYLFFDEHPVDAPGKGSCIVTAKRLIIRDSKGEPQYLLDVIEDVTERKRSDERIAHLAHYDALTDLPNRVLFREQLEQSLKWVHRGACLAVLYLDLDQFKTVNDTLGHSVGDELLKAVAARLRACLRDTDIVARLGGDEFAIIQTAIAGPIDVIDLVNRIHEEIREPYEAGGHQLIADASIGIAMAPDDGTDSDQLLKNADLAMYGAKADGRGTYRFFEPNMDARVKARRALEFDLREAIMCGGFELYYQPLVNLRDNKVSGCEALLRWRHREHGMILPAEFIPLAEETGLITQLGEWVLRTACAEAATWPDDIKVAVNVSPVQFKSGSLVQMVINALATSRLPAPRLELEITEAVLIRDDEAALVVLHQLRELGVRIVMDDFGTGYSSLSYLQRFPFDKIKIDRSFIKNIAEADGSHSIVQAVVTIATARNITTTAEGVETEQQLELVRTLGCTEMQGYLFSRPRPVSEIYEFFAPGAEKAAQVA